MAALAQREDELFIIRTERGAIDQSLAQKVSTDEEFKNWSDMLCPPGFVECLFGNTMSGDNSPAAANGVAPANTGATTKAKSNQP